MGERPPGATSARDGWPLLALLAACGAVLVANTGRYLPPAGDRFADQHTPAAADLLPTMNAANALLHGESPYPPALTAPLMAAAAASYVYPTLRALCYVPLAWLTGRNFVAATRVQLALSLLCLGWLAFVTLQLLRALVPIERSTAFMVWALFVFAIGLNPGNQLGLARGQSHLVCAALAWSAVWMFGRGWLVSAGFVIVAATLLQGYSVLLAVGLICLVSSLRDLARIAAGAVVALALAFSPLLHVLPGAWHGYPLRSPMFWSHWSNQSFYNLAYVIGLPAQPMRCLWVGLTLSAAALAWLQRRRAEHLASTKSQQTLWLTAFASAALSTALGWPQNSAAYDCVIFMPGALVLAFAQRQLVDGWPNFLRPVAGLWLAAASFGLFIFDPGRAIGVHEAALPVPTAALAQIAFAVVIAAAGAHELGRIRISHARSMRAVALVLAACALALGAKLLIERISYTPSLTSGKSWVASSRVMPCDAKTKNCGGGQAGVFFHTEIERSPWLQFDLGVEETIGKVDVLNREDCCTERAIPLLIEVSQDAASWRAVAQQAEPFTEWEARFAPVTARYVRLRVNRRSTLHLERVAIRAK
jgi:hypothetical protein